LVESVRGGAVSMAGVWSVAAGSSAVERRREGGKTQVRSRGDYSNWCKSSEEVAAAAEF
jgi:hypothetical protein